jgi:hypothetical protein
MDEVIDWEGRLKKLLVIVGRPGRCKGCDTAVYWVATRRDALLPYTAEGLPHFSDCPKAAEFRKKKSKQE